MIRFLNNIIKVVLMIFNPVTSKERKIRRLYKEETKLKNEKDEALETFNSDKLNLVNAKLEQLRRKKRILYKR